MVKAMSGKTCYFDCFSVVMLQYGIDIMIALQRNPDIVNYIDIC